uniref:RDD family protein n=1 Tax=Orrella sp. TaxID=1921583 RepID=UPI004047AB91
MSQIQHNAVMQQTNPLEQSKPLNNTVQAPDVSRLKRFAAMMYEGVLLFAVVFTTAYIFDVATESKHGLLNREARIFVLFLAIGAYFLVCWQRGGQTLPMRAWHIRLVGATGQKPTFKQLIIRYLLIWPLPLLGMAILLPLISATGWKALLLLSVFAPFLIFIPTFGSNHQFLHDRLAGTRLVDIRSETKDAAKQ